MEWEKPPELPRAGAGAAHVRGCPFLISISQTSNLWQLHRWVSGRARTKPGFCLAVTLHCPLNRIFTKCRSLHSSSASFYDHCVLWPWRLPTAWDNANNFFYCRFLKQMEKFYWNSFCDTYIIQFYSENGLWCFMMEILEGPAPCCALMGTDTNSVVISEILTWTQGT